MITIAAAPISITPVTLADSRVTLAYGATLHASGGTGGYAWSVTAGGLPGGLALDAVSGALSGSATTAGTFAFDVTATDASDPTNHSTASLSIHIGSSPVAVTTTTLPGGRATQSYAASLSASGGSAAYAWSIVSGSLPAGLALDPASGAVSGTPGSAGPSAFTIRVTDASDSTNTADAAFTITLATAPVYLVGGVLAGDRLSVPYASGLTASGGCGTYRWNVVAGALPSGILLDASAGSLSGTPVAAGVYTFTASAADAVDATNTASASFSITIAAAPVLVTTTALAGGRERVAYSVAVHAGGGGGGYAWSVVSGLPAGLTLNGSTGAISGTPTTAGTYAVTLKATDSGDAANAATATLSLLISPAIKITSPRTLPGATAGTAYTYAVSYANAVGTTKWNLQGGALPPGLSLDPATGSISGIPTTKGTYSFNARVKDSNTDDTLTLTVTVR
jgi:hypothetical protein